MERYADRRRAAVSVDLSTHTVGYSTLTRETDPTLRSPITRVGALGDAVAQVIPEQR
jgi:hypothetical protein